MWFYGHHRPTTPYLDQLAAESAVFERAIAQAAVTPVSHASIFTGLDPYHHGLRVLHGLEANRLEPGQTTLAEVLGAEGFQTAAFVSAFPASAAFGLDQGFEHFDADLPQVKAQLVSEQGTVNTGPSQRTAQATTAAALRWLEEEATADKPVFLWLHYFDPHDIRLLPPRELVDEFPPSFPQDREDVLKTIYDAEIRFVDEQIGRVLETFRGQRPWDETIVAVVADHGEGLGDHGWWSHGILYQEQIRVPLLVRAPGYGGVRVDSMVRTTDLMPTLLELLGVEKGRWPGMDGVSFEPALAHGELQDERIAYADSVSILNYGRQDDPTRQDEKTDKLYSIIRGDLKLIYHQLQPENSELYDLAEDPRELHNLAAERRDELHELIRELRRRNALSDLMPGEGALDTEHAERLRSLGYIQ